MLPTKVGTSCKQARTFYFTCFNRYIASTPKIWQPQILHYSDNFLKNHYMHEIREIINEEDQWNLRLFLYTEKI